MCNSCASNTGFTLGISPATPGLASYDKELAYWCPYLTKCCLKLYNSSHLFRKLGKCLSNNPKDLSKIYGRKIFTDLGFIICREQPEPNRRQIFSILYVLALLGWVQYITPNGRPRLGCIKKRFSLILYIRGEDISLTAVSLFTEPFEWFATNHDFSGFQI